MCETIERRPASLVVARVIRPKFLAKDRQRDAETEVFVAEPLELPIPRGLAGPGMLADTIVRRWQDHMPLNRLEDMYARDGIELARSTMCGWHGALNASHGHTALFKIPAGYQHLGLGVSQRERRFISQSPGSPGDDRQLSLLGRYICN